jgi:phosphatidylinositol alpha-1,6-mannosyltransferase
LRLLFVAHCFPPAGRPLSKVGGMQRVGMDLMAALEQRGDVIVEPLVLRAAGAGMVAKAAPFYGYAFARILQRCRSGEIDAVLFSAMPSAWMALFLKPLLGRRRVPMAVICHGHDVIWSFPPWQAMVRRMFQTLDAVMPVSRATGEEVLKRSLPPERLHVINNGIDLDRYPPPPDPAQRRVILANAFPREAAGLPEGALVLVIAGRQVPRKGHAWFVREVMARLPAHVRLWLAGDGPEAGTIDAAAAQLDDPSRVVRLGLVDEAQLAALYRGGDLFVMPNVPTSGDIEGFGVVILEAGLNGMPAVAASLEGIRDAVTPGENGVLVPPADAEGFTDAILSFDRDRGKLAEAGRRASAFTRATFGWDAVAGRYVRVLAALASTSR